MLPPLCGEPGVLKGMNGGVEEQGLKMGMHRIGWSVMRKSGLIRNCYATELERSGGC